MWSLIDSVVDIYKMDDTLYFYIVYDCFRGVKKQVMIKTKTNTFISSGLLEIKIEYIENRKFKR